MVQTHGRASASLPLFCKGSGLIGKFDAPAFSNANIGGALSTANEQGINPQTSQFAVGDLLVQPVWLGWHRKQLDVAADCGFYAPVGKFDAKTINFPVGASGRDGCGERRIGLVHQPVTGEPNCLQNRTKAEVFGAHQLISEQI